MDRVDTIVIGGSAGSLEEIRFILARLDPSLPATLLICKHLGYGSPDVLLDILANGAALPVIEGEENQKLEPGTAVVAGPDAHMLIGQDHVHVRRGAHENNFRPAIDPLFRSAAVYRGPRSIGVVLSGLLDDGASGARAMARTGGRILVRDPAETDFPSMPRAAIAAHPEAEVLGLEDIPRRISELAGCPVEDTWRVPPDIGIELKLASLEGASIATEERLGDLSPYNCPACNGVLWEIDDGPILRYRCHTGHAFTIDALSTAQEEAIDDGLFDALRAHRGRASLLRRLSGRATDDAGRRQFEERAVKAEEDADLIEGIIKGRRNVPVRSRAGRA